MKTTFDGWDFDIQVLIISNIEQHATGCELIHIIQPNSCSPRGFISTVVNYRFVSHFKSGIRISDCFGKISIHVRDVSPFLPASHLVKATVQPLKPRDTFCNVFIFVNHILGGLCQTTSTCISWYLQYVEKRIWGQHVHLQLIFPRM